MQDDHLTRLYQLLTIEIKTYPAVNSQVLTKVGKKIKISD